MELKTFLAAMGSEDRDRFAKRCGTSIGHLQNIKYGMKSCATDLAVNIERESRGEVRRWDLRPDDWWKHWPELIGAEGAPAVPDSESRTESAAVP